MGYIAWGVAYVEVDMTFRILINCENNRNEIMNSGLMVSGMLIDERLIAIRAPKYKQIIE